MSLEPAKQTFKVWRGTTFRQAFELWQDDAQTDPYDLDGYSATLTIREKLAGTIYHEAEADIEDNLITIVISHTDTAEFEWSQAVYELTLTLPNGDVDILFYGIFQVKDHA
jgi:hypothetical protein